MDKTNGRLELLGLLAQLALDLLFGKVRLVMPDIFLSWLINLGKGILVGLEFGGGGGRGIAGNVAEENDSIAYYKHRLARAHRLAGARKHTELAEFAVGDEQGTESLESLGGLVGILLGRFLVDRRGELFDIFASDSLGFPDEFLQQLSLVLGQEEVFGLLNDIAQVLHQSLAVFGQLARGGSQPLGVGSAVQSNVALFILFQVN